MDATQTGPLSAETAEAGRASVAELMRSIGAYDVMAESSKVVVFDTSIPVRLAFYALVEHGAAARRAARAAGPRSPRTPR